MSETNEIPIPLDHLSDRELLLLTATAVNVMAREMPAIKERLTALERYRTWILGAIGGVTGVSWLFNWLLHRK